jgi:hypothetical protein
MREARGTGREAREDGAIHEGREYGIHDDARYKATHQSLSSADWVSVSSSASCLVTMLPRAVDWFGS